MSSMIFARAAEERPTPHRSLGAVVEFEWLPYRDHQCAWVSSTLGADLTQIHHTGFDILHQRARRMPAITQGNRTANGTPAVAANPDGMCGFCTGFRLEPMCSKRT